MKLIFNIVSESSQTSIRVQVIRDTLFNPKNNNEILSEINMKLDSYYP